MKDLELLTPAWLWLLVLLPLIWLGRRATLTDFAPHQTAISALVRSLLFFAITLALARPTVVEKSDRISAVFLLDVSDSVSEDQIAFARTFVDQARHLQKIHEMHLVTFAKSPAVMPLPPDSETPSFRRHPQADATDIQAAMQLATALFSPQAVHRLVLLSDGNETAGHALDEAKQLSQAGIRLDVVTLPPRTRPEFVFRKITLPSRITLGRPFEVTAEISATEPAQATLSLDQNDLPNPLEPARTVDLVAGNQIVRLKSIVRQPGQVVYRGKLEVSRPDTIPQNNQQAALAIVEGKPRVLVCDGEPGQSQAFVQVLRDSQMDVELRGPSGLPRSLRELERYNLLVLSDVPDLFVGPEQVAAIKTYVKDWGGGLLFAAGASVSQGEALAPSALEELLPVRFDSERKRTDPVLALMLVLDKSGSMAGEKIELAKEAARVTAELLAPSDLLGVIAFDSQPLPIVRLQKVLHRQRMATDIARIVASGGTSILPALQEAFAQLQPTRAKVKHVILLSDGQSAYQGSEDLLRDMTQAQISVSTVGVGDGADRTLLSQIAEWSGGRFYAVQDASNVPRIFVKETTEVARSSLMEELTYAQPVKRTSALSGIDFATAPPLRGYATSQVKPLAELLLGSQVGEPLLSRWNLGAGKVLAWTSDVKARWSAEWLSWSGFSKMWAQLARATMQAQAPSEGRFALHVEMLGDHEAQIIVDTLDRKEQFIDGLEGEVVAINPNSPGERTATPLRQIAPGRYLSTLALSPGQSLLLRAVLKKNSDVVGQADGAVASAYPEEYAQLTLNPSLGQELAHVTGGKFGATAKDVFHARGDHVLVRRELWPGLLGAAAVLLLLDVFLRRIRLFQAGRTL